MEKISKTAKASMRVGTGNTRTPYGWVMRKRPGKIETKPCRIFFNAVEFNAYVADLDTENFTAVSFGR